MKCAMATSLRSIRATAMCIAVYAACWPAASRAAGPPNFEGTWKQSVTQAAFSPVGGVIPFTATGRQQYEANKASLAAGKYEAYDMANARCASPGLPRLMLTPKRFRIWQRSGLIEFQFEWNRLTREIILTDLIPQTRIGGIGIQDEELVGRAAPLAKGSWEGDTLVVSTDGFDDTTLVDNLVPHGHQLKLVEHIRLKAHNTLEDRIRFEDAEYFTHPWEAVVTYHRQSDEGFPEDVCLDRLVDGQPTL
jgi:hypothetical protein